MATLPPPVEWRDLVPGTAYTKIQDGKQTYLGIFLHSDQGSRNGCSIYDEPTITFQDLSGKRHTLAVLDLRPTKTILVSTAALQALKPS